MLTGITVVRNGNRLKYPWKECIRSMSQYCDQVIVNIGDSNDFTEEDADHIAPNVMPIHFQWDMSNTGDGRELARQANNLLPYVDTPWVIYLQADEFVAEWETDLLKLELEQLPLVYTQLELYRTYFYGSLTKRRPADEIWLGRVFRKDTHEIGGDGMWLVRNEGLAYRSVYDIKIFHYSRIGTEEEITNRVRTLDRLFHPEEEVQKMSPFKYTTDGLIDYNGAHPKEALNYYGI